MRDIRARGVTWVFLHGVPKRPMHESMKVKFQFHQRPEDVGDAKAMECLLIKTANRPREKGVNKN